MLTVKETRAALGICRNEVYSRIWRGQLTSEKVGHRRMITMDSVRRELARQAAAY